MFARPTVAHIAAALAAAALAGCHPRLPNAQLAEAISVRCAPVADLLKKNLRASGKLRVAGIAGAAAEYETSGAVVEGLEAQQVQQLDNACRAWVAGALSDADYKALIVSQMAGAISLTEEPDTQAARLDQLSAELRALPEYLRPAIPSVSDIAAAVTRFNQQPAEVVTNIVGDQARPNPSSADLADLTARVDYLTQLIEGASSPDRPEPPVVHRTDGIDVYFSTGSAELTHDGANQIDRVGNVWSAAGRRVSVVGYADATGSADLNARLSQDRAEVVARRLRAVGVAVVDVRGVGAENTPPTAYSRARRVTVTAADQTSSRS